MPKEYIETTEHSDKDIHGVVLWSRDKFVQIATEKKGAVATADEPARQSEGFYLSLSRYDINRLIRTLRKARDQAFGADA